MLLMVGCASSPKNPKQVIEEYEVFQGVRVAEAELKDGNERLDIYLGVRGDDPEEEGHESVVFCIAENPEEEPLPEIAALINQTPSDKPIYLYGVKVTEKYGHWYGGLDCRVKAIAVWHTKAERYVYVDPEHAPSWKWQDFRGVLRRAVKKAGSAGLDLVDPR